MVRKEAPAALTIGRLAEATGVHVETIRYYEKIGLLMGVAQLIGANLGSRLVILKGAGLVRPMLIIMSLLITINLVVKDDSHFLHRWLVWFFADGV